MRQRIQPLISVLLSGWFMWLIIRHSAGLWYVLPWWLFLLILGVVWIVVDSIVIATNAYLRRQVP